MFMQRRGRLRTTSLLLGAFWVIGSTTQLMASTTEHETHFVVSFAGLEIGKAQFSIKFNDSSYSLEGIGKTTGLAEWFAPGKGEVASSGKLIEAALQPQKHFVSVTERKKKN